MIGRKTAAVLIVAQAVPAVVFYHLATVRRQPAYLIGTAAAIVAGIGIKGLRSRIVRKEIVLGGLVFLIAIGGWFIVWVVSRMAAVK